MSAPVPKSTPPSEPLTFSQCKALPVAKRPSACTVFDTDGFQKAMAAAVHDMRKHLDSKK